MPNFVHAGPIQYLTFPCLSELDIPHGVFSRLGGVSKAPWASLNMGAAVGDPIENVRENRKRAVNAIQRDISSVQDTWLVHGTDTVFADSPHRPGADTPKGDILLTNRPEVTLMMRFADCTPILLVDPVMKVVGFAHAGWLGTVRFVAMAAVRAMEAHYLTKPANVIAVIGPAICVDHYPVGEEVVEQVRAAFGRDAERVIQRMNGRVHFDLWLANQLVLEKAGVRKIEQSNLCTACDTAHWYSHRAENGKTGRFGAAISLPAS